MQPKKRRRKQPVEPVRAKRALIASRKQPSKPRRKPPPKKQRTAAPRKEPQPALKKRPAPARKSISKSRAKPAIKTKAGRVPPKSQPASMRPKAVRSAKAGVRRKAAPARAGARKPKVLSPAQKGWETRRRKAAAKLRATARREHEEKAARKPRRKPARPAKTPKQRENKAAKTRRAKRAGLELEDVKYFERTGFIHRVYDVGDYDPETFEVDPDAIELAIDREISEGKPGTVHGTISGITEDGTIIERNTPAYPTQPGVGTRLSKALAHIVAFYELMGVYKITLTFLPERQGYDNTTKGERKRIRRIRSR